jgi:uncharacterized membrane protein YdcZ (DUF606 family)
LYRAAIQWIQGAATALAASGASFLVGAAAFFVDAISVEAAISYERGQSETDYWAIIGGWLASLLVITLLVRDAQHDEDILVE